MTGPLSEIPWGLMLLAAAGRGAGRMLFAAVFVVLIVWLLLVPAERLGLDPRAAWWRNPRVWGAAIAATQVLVYLLLG